MSAGLIKSSLHLLLASQHLYSSGGREWRIRKELSEGLEGINAQVVGIAANATDALQIASRAVMAPSDRNVDISTLESLVHASNKHTTNTITMNTTLDTILARIVALERLDVRITAIQATTESNSHTIQTLLGAKRARGDKPDTVAKRHQPSLNG
ncbi:hypothetical protein C8J57DRAFT_1514103 [Mycena rebaudengoi]|nr:hypothetical protein C8J57DRAFT_1514103 [Mycena rebaudengoi]